MLVIRRLVGLAVALTLPVALEDVESLILSADKTLIDTERISQMFGSSPSFIGISGTVDLFQATFEPLERESEEILESLVVEAKISYPAEKGKSQVIKNRNVKFLKLLV